MTEPVGEGFPVPRGFLRVGGVTVARHQLGVVQALACQRVVCITRNVGADVIALQHDAEAAGLQFHLIADARGLARLVTSADEVFILAEGLLPDPGIANDLLGERAVVLVQPVEAGLAAGFERIDFNHATAGALRVPGRLVDGLADLPPDCDIPSALTRIALQGGVPTSEIPAGLLASPRWRLVRDEGEARNLEDDWLRLHTGMQLSATPGNWLARNFVQQIGPTLLHGGNGSRWLFAASAMLVASVAMLAWFRLTGTGLLITALAVVLAVSGEMLRRIEAGVGPRAVPAVSPATALGWAADAGIVWLAVQDQPLQAWESTADRAFPAIMLVLVARLLARVLPTDLAAWAEDRVWLLLVLAMLAGFGLLAPSLHLLTIGFSLAGLVLAGGVSRLTRS